MLKLESPFTSLHYDYVFLNGLFIFHSSPKIYGTKEQKCQIFNFGFSYKEI